MADPTKDTDQGAKQDLGPKEVPEKTDDGLDNAGWKSHPLTQKLTGEIAALRQAEAKRTAAQEAKEKAAELAKATESQDYKEALRLMQEANDKEIRAYKTEALKAQVEAKLLQKGAKVTEALVKVAMAEYDPKQHSSVDALADSLAANEAYAPFFASQKQAPAPEPPRKLSAGSGGPENWEQVKAWENSPKREDRIKAREILAKYRQERSKTNKDGIYPY